jgi:hypothetical protein
VLYNILLQVQRAKGVKLGVIQYFVTGTMSEGVYNIYLVTGTMSGGGKTVCRGRMGSSIASEVDPKELNNMENSLEKACRA